MKIYPKGKAVRLAKNFVSTEFDCHGKCCCSETPIDEELVKILQQVRDHFGVSVTVNSGFRCSKHNSRVSGASKTSQHMQGKAADIVVKGIHPVRVARYVETLKVNGRIGCYTWDERNGGFVHIDTRGKKSRAYYTDGNVDYDTVDTFSPVIKSGSKGKAVMVIQRKLHALGYYHDVIDGKCGNNTARAIVLFNFYHGRPQDPVWGPKCWEEAFPIK